MPSFRRDFYRPYGPARVSAPGADADLPWFVVTDYGAVADSTGTVNASGAYDGTNNVTAFQAAIDAAGSAGLLGGATVFVPCPAPGRGWRFASTLSLRRNVRIVFEGPGGKYTANKTYWDMGIQKHVSVENTAWSADGGYATGARVEGMHILGRTPGVWASGRITSPGEMCRPTNTLANGFFYIAVQVGLGNTGANEPGTGGTPAWPTTVGATVVNNSVTWQCRQGYGFFVTARCHLERCYVESIPGDGYHYRADSGGYGGSEPASDGNLLSRAYCDSFNNLRDGFYISGQPYNPPDFTAADGNAGGFVFDNAFGNGRWGINDESDIGNTYYNPHTNSNGYVAPGARWPGSLADYEAGNGGGAFRSTGANGTCTWINPYSEGGQGGGNGGAGVYGGSHFVGATVVFGNGGMYGGYTSGTTAVRYSDAVEPLMYIRNRNRAQTFTMAFNRGTDYQLIDWTLPGVETVRQLLDTSGVHSGKWFTRSDTLSKRLWGWSSADDFDGHAFYVTDYLHIGGIASGGVREFTDQTLMFSGDRFRTMDKWINTAATSGGYRGKCCVTAGMGYNTIVRSTAYTLGTVRIDPVTGTIQRVTTAGTTAAGAPAFSTTFGNTTADGSVTWTCGLNVSAWATPGGAVTKGDLVKQTAGAVYFWKARNSGTKGGAEPSWNASDFGANTTDNTVTWALAGMLVQGAIWRDCEPIT